MTGVTENYPVRIWREGQRRKMPFPRSRLPVEVLSLKRYPLRAIQLCSMSAAARLPTFLSITSRPRSSSGLSSENTLFICPECCVPSELARPSTIVFPRRTSHHFLKGFGEGACGFVAKGLRDFRDGIAGIRYSVSGQQHSPVRQVLHRRNPNCFPEP